MIDHNSNQIDYRHQRRIELMKAVFACSFYFDDYQIDNYKETEIYSDLKDLFLNVEAIDSKIQKVADERPLDQINKVDLAILRTVMFESVSRDTPKKVLINEGIEIAKEFSGKNSPKFINGVLGQLLIEKK
jgi:transcription antitermination protein NusB